MDTEKKEKKNTPNIIRINKCIHLGDLFFIFSSCKNSVFSEKMSLSPSIISVLSVKGWQLHAFSP